MAKGTRGGKRSLGGTEKQKAKINRLESKLKIGSKGAPKFGGESSRITKPITFKRAKNGDIEYSVTGERNIPARKFSTFGVGDTKARTRVTISTGVIKPDGLIIHNKNKTVEK